MDEPEDVAPASPTTEERVEMRAAGRVGTCRDCGSSFTVQTRVGPLPWRCSECRTAKTVAAEEPERQEPDEVVEPRPRRDASYLGVRLSKEARGYLQELQATGLYGPYESEVAGRLIDAALLDLIGAGRLVAHR